MHPSPSFRLWRETGYILKQFFFLFQNCVEQPFDDDKVNVSKNGPFAEEFAVNIREYMTHLETRIGKVEK